MRYDLSSATSDSIELATAAAITEAERHVTAAVAADGDPSTVHHLDEAMRVVLDAGGYGPFLMHGDPDESVRDAGAAAAETLGKWTSDLVFRREIFEAVSAVDPSAVTGLEARSLDEWRRDLRRAGHELSAEDRETLRGLRTRLIELEIAFSKNIADFSDGIDLGPDDRAGLPGSLLESLPEGSTDGTLRVTLDYPAYTPFMQQSARRDLRQTLQYKFYNQAVDTNRPLLEEAIEVRTHIADLLGYDDWAEHQLETEMADSGAVEEMYRSIVPGLTARARHEKAALETMLHADAPGAVLSAWDWAYYDTQQAKADFGVDQNEIAEYFPLETTIDGMFEITGTVFGIRYEPAPDEPVWHDDVRAYRVIDTSMETPIAVFFLDLHPRDGKFTHAACWDLQKGCRNADGSYRMPYAAVLCNFTKPTSTGPSLLQHDEVVTLFHEFGHVLHNVLTTVDIARFAGTATEGDFVEAPSQIMENWCWDASVLNRFAAHHETGEPLPTELLDGLIRLRDHNIALKTLRQCYYGRLDLSFHTSGPRPDLSTLDREANTLTQLPFHEGTFLASGFGHLMGGYDAGYYGYLWAMVYGDDMFSVFTDEGVLSPDVGRRYRDEVLATGRSRDAIDHLRAFLGRDPNTDAFMRKMGLE